MMRTYPKFYITPKGEKAARRGHPWVYGEEVTKVEGSYENGDLVDVLTAKGKYVGTGFVNDHSKIRVRLLSNNANDKFDEAFWERRLRYAIAYRRVVMPGADFKCCRLIFGEADQFPGLTVDRFNDLLVTQTLSLGIEKRKNLLFPLLVKILRDEGEDIKGLYERNDVNIRLKEGLTMGQGFYELPGLNTPSSALTTIVENGLVYEVNVENGQKTGFFLDQKYNRQSVARISKDRHVLDCFTHTGSFGLNAAKGGNYFNFADKNKVNIEITLIGGNGSGRYLIPQGTTVFDILLMSGGAGRRNLGGIKLLRFASDTPKLKPNEVIELDFSTLYSEDVKEIKSSSLNPVLKAGDMVIVPRPASEPQSFWVYLTTIMSYATTLISFYYVITNVFRYNRP